MINDQIFSNLGGIPIYSNVIVHKSFDFSLEIIDIYKVLVFNKEFILSKQLLRSRTSIGANIKEAIKGYTKTEFLYKMNIALKEANESEYWLELIIKSKILEDDNTLKALQDCKEICRILSKIAWNCRK
jgi:four helix bundle protein